MESDFSKKLDKFSNKLNAYLNNLNYKSKTPMKLQSDTHSNINPNERNNNITHTKKARAHTNNIILTKSPPH